MDLRPHVVILGAGASAAAFPNGDARGNPLPTMQTLIDVVGLAPLLRRIGVTGQTEDFESVYSRLHSQHPASPTLREMEETVYAYFAGLSLPETPSLYDHLILSLRPKDVVATFNWDPFLFDAWHRNRDFAPLPEIVHLHGNVRVGCCLRDRLQGRNGGDCPECNQPLVPTRLLYPVEVKDYTANPFLEQEWKQLRWALRNAFALTIFGYSAPATDVEAAALMGEAWSGDRRRIFETSEVIDIKDKQTLREQWRRFTYSQHFLYASDFYDSWIPRHSRRSCEALYYPTVKGLFVEDADFPRDSDFNGLRRWIEGLAQAEHQLDTRSGL